MKGFIMKYPFMVIILIILLVLTTVSLIRSIQTINELDVEEPIAYTETDGKTEVVLPSGITATLSFGKNTVSIYPSAGTTHEDAAVLATFIKGYAKKQGMSLSRPTTELIGEYRLHTILADLGYRTDRTDKADLEYDEDKRWYVNFASCLLGILGI